MNDGKKGVNSILRAIDILKTLAREGEQGTTEIARKTGLHKSTVSRLLATLGRERLVEQNPENGKYRLGIGLFELGMVYASRLDLRKHALPYLRQVMQATGEVAHLGIRDGLEVIYLEKVEANHSLTMMSRVGARVTLYSTSLGKAMLAFLPEEQRERIIERIEFEHFTKNTVKDADELRKQLDLIRQQGYALDDEENETGIRCIGVPIRDYSDTAVAAISVSGPTIRVTKSKVNTFAPVLLEVGKKLSQSIGWQG